MINLIIFLSLQVILSTHQTTYEILWSNKKLIVLLRDMIIAISLTHNIRIHIVLK